MDKGREVAPNKRGIFLGETGAKITIATTSEQELGRVPVIQDALDHGIRRCLSGDVEVCLAGEMFTQMRTSVTTRRMVGEGGSLLAMQTRRCRSVIPTCSSSQPRARKRLGAAIKWTR
jgi:hypothetical protein